MKNQFLTMATALLVVFSTSCKKENKPDDTTKVPTKEEILTDGTWDLNTVHYTTKIGSVTFFEGTDTLSGKVTFTTDHKMISHIPGEEDDEGTWILKGDSIFVDGIPGYLAELSTHKMRMISSFSATDSTMGQITLITEANLTR